MRLSNFYFFSGTKTSAQGDDAFRNVVGIFSDEKLVRETSNCLPEEKFTRSADAPWTWHEWFMHSGGGIAVYSCHTHFTKEAKDPRLRGNSSWSFDVQYDKDSEPQREKAYRIAQRMEASGLISIIPVTEPARPEYYI